MDKTLEFVNKLYPIANYLYINNNGLNPYFIVAQAALESSWGDKAIGNNFFGVTKGNWTGDVQLITTTEYFNSNKVKFNSPEEIIGIKKSGNKYKYTVKRLFRKYDSVYDSLLDHTKILSSDSYSDIWKYKSDPYKLADAIVDGVGSKYATNPNYAKILKSVINSVKTRVNKLGIEEDANPGSKTL